LFTEKSREYIDAGPSTQRTGRPAHSASATSNRVGAAPTGPAACGVRSKQIVNSLNSPVNSRFLALTKRTDPGRIDEMTAPNKQEDATHDPFQNGFRTGPYTDNELASHD
jgi:hypothetical protein